MAIKTMTFSVSGLEARIHLDRLRENIALVRSRIPDHVRLMGVVKCDGYGHGIVTVSRVLTACGVSDLVTANVEEGPALRAAGISGTILVLSDPLHPRLQDALDHDLTLTVGDVDFAARLLSHPTRSHETFKVHVKVDTGLTRFGLPMSRVEEVMSLLARSPNIRVDGIYSHLCGTFQDDEESNAFTRRQVDTFNLLLDRLERAGLLPPLVHLGSSTGLLGFPRELCSGHFNALRIGTLFYGFMERPNRWSPQPVPIAELTTSILQVRDVPSGTYIGYGRRYRMPRDGRVAVLQVGFHQGLHGDLPGTLSPLVHGRPAALIGRPTMSQTLLDVSHVPEAQAGSRVLLAGQDINMQRVAGNMGRGTWELLLPLLRNSRKEYLEEERPCAGRKKSPSLPS